MTSVLKRTFEFFGDYAKSFGNKYGDTRNTMITIAVGTPLSIFFSGIAGLAFGLNPTHWDDGSKGERESARQYVRYETEIKKIATVNGQEEVQEARLAAVNLVNRFMKDQTLSEKDTSSLIFKAPALPGITSFYQLVPETSSMAHVGAIQHIQDCRTDFSKVAQDYTYKDLYVCGLNKTRAQIGTASIVAFSGLASLFLGAPLPGAIGAFRRRRAEEQTKEKSATRTSRGIVRIKREL